MAGGLRSIILPPIGSAVVQFPATSHTERVPVNAFAVSTPVATDVESEKEASARFASPEPPESVAVQPIEILLACHTPSAVPQRTFGAVRSIRTTRDSVDSILPQLSSAKKETVVTPDAVMLKLALEPLTTVIGITCAPAELYVIRRTPEPPALSVAFKVTVTSVLFQPRLGTGDTELEVVGAVVSTAMRVSPIRVPQLFAVVAANSPCTQMPVPLGSTEA